jgi:hypothetical protein
MITYYAPFIDFDINCALSVAADPITRPKPAGYQYWIQIIRAAESGLD